MLTKQGRRNSCFPYWADWNDSFILNNLDKKEEIKLSKRFPNKLINTDTIIGREIEQSPNNKGVLIIDVMQENKTCNLSNPEKYVRQIFLSEEELKLINKLRMFNALEDGQN